ncbi:succinylglutamate desuccinylase/aspartoacylase family protein [Cognataquiflexum aquatile]|uniref:succinylglutamate desuccinylase/aspartoacylase family protein n=1 Tax=Cognataquiflexum aquatile TaxID=2249427 RepID=UPI000DE8785F|nr:succinylglutamate desuccinylase/aspartoacylase family protein [Cognataquiflexum aquatile]
MKKRNPQNRFAFVHSLLITVLFLSVVNLGCAQKSIPTTAPRISTVYTGDIINGKKVVSSLNTDDLEAGKKHLLYFQGVQMSTGQHWYVSVIVAKGAKPGKRFTITSGVHGDEMSPIHTVLAIMDQLNVAEMSGTVMAVTDIARPALESMQRRWPSSGRGTELSDMNREWPGNENGFSPVSRHAGLVFNRLLLPNTDLAIDFHTGATGLDAAVFNIGDMSNEDVKTMNMLYPVQMIWDNAAYPGLLHNAYMDAGIPCFTPEIGVARRLELDLIPIFVEGTMNVFKHYRVIPGVLGRTTKDAKTYIGKNAVPIFVTQGGFIELFVKIGEKIVPGQKLAIQRNAFGEIVAEYNSPVNGLIAGMRSDATAEPGHALFFILSDASPVTGLPSFVD